MARRRTGSGASPLADESTSFSTASTSISATVDWLNWHKSNVWMDSLFKAADAKLSFSLKTFFIEWAEQSLFPLLLPFMMCVHTRAYLHNRQYTKPVNNGFAIQWFFTVLVIAANVLYIVYRDEDDFQVTFFEVFLLDLLLLLQRGTVAIKYAYYSPSDLHEVNTRPMEGQDLVNKLVLSGWSYPTEESAFMEFERSIGRKAPRLGSVPMMTPDEEFATVFLDSIDDTVDSYIKHECLSRAALGLDTKTGMGSRVRLSKRSIPMKVLAWHIIRTAWMPMPFVRKCTRALSVGFVLVVGCMPWSTRVWAGLPPDGGSIEACVTLILITVGTLFFAYVTLEYVMVGVHNHWRLLNALREMGHMIDAESCPSTLHEAIDPTWGQTCSVELSNMVKGGMQLGASSADARAGDPGSDAVYSIDADDVSEDYGDISRRASATGAPDLDAVLSDTHKINPIHGQVLRTIKLGAAVVQPARPRAMQPLPAGASHATAPTAGRREDRAGTPAAELPGAVHSDSEHDDESSPGAAEAKAAPRPSFRSRDAHTRTPSSAGPSTAASRGTPSVPSRGSSPAAGFDPRSSVTPDSGSTLLAPDAREAPPRHAPESSPASSVGEREAQELLDGVTSPGDSPAACASALDRVAHRPGAREVDSTRARMVRRVQALPIDTVMQLLQELEGHTELPVLYPSNITGWVLCRDVVHDFGASFRYRVDVYTSMYGLAGLAMVFFLLYVAVFASVADVTMAIVLPTTLSYELMFCCALILQIIPATLTNRQNIIHRQALDAVESLALQYLTISPHLSEDARHYLRDTARATFQAQVALRNHLERTPVRVLGIPAGFTLFTGLLSLALTGAWAVYRASTDDPLF